MGGADCICSDKTGTLTENVMKVQTFWSGNELKKFDTDDKVTRDLSESF